MGGLLPLKGRFLPLSYLATIGRIFSPYEIVCHLR